MEILLIILVGIAYPGLITAIALGLAYRRLLGVGGGSLRWAAAWGSREGLAALAGVLAAAMGLAVMPWPFHPAGVTRAWLWAWPGLELAFLLPLAPALASGVPKVVRAAMRRTQIGAFGRALLWVALASSLVIHADWRMAALPVHLLAMAAALVAFPIAVGWGPFDDEASITGAGIHAGLAPALCEITDLAHDVATGALLAAALLAILPIAVVPIWLVPILLIFGFGVVVGGLGRLQGRLPRLSLPAIMHFGWAYAAPLAAAAAVALIIAGRLVV
ncbi:MAG: hypothetical protein HGA65_01590 [Oscillochloris sp.]|nr:hypothetical protein [Oscillochloris sp.]